MFTVEERDRIRERILALAGDDARIVAGAELGSAAAGAVDRYSDLDLSFAVEDGTPPLRVLDDLTAAMGELDAKHLVDVSRGPWIYRVFLLPGLLQVDVSMTPASEFRPLAPTFRLLFGAAGEPRHGTPPDPRDLFGWAVHHALRARFCVERGRPWQAQRWLAELRNEALTLACVRHGLPSGNGRGYDRLPPDVVAPFEATLVRSLARDELLRALAAGVEALRAVAPDLAEPLGAQLDELTAT